MLYELSGLSLSADCRPVLIGDRIVVVPDDAAHLQPNNGYQRPLHD
ncbi:hypothetical protein JWG42_12000 [Desulfoprunum benzoelyticum]|uniref:Uncharacterized protein n=1 Tax=Desulfoprunum benzoelyticum TaxID=1506996 RepID=A0A840V383_9BACT|nr:hypothetical protein [Desulfoprunum benzoelyticum]MBB5348199.1 hypothetical protein [Desulfoprunum benzoelyticum]MBM9530873.1 hypothetical protein [Desulfoprunum benzoelyticum]